ncbi:MAG TPA: hypothetical protein DEP43_06615 [Ruminococcaceae bacterium]|nr:hypothetical protein [Oscillospiraceae bacterium]HCB65616.1 hypothetical protein [Oscillospiraceae bacterium]
MWTFQIAPRPGKYNPIKRRMQGRRMESYANQNAFSFHHMDTGPKNLFFFLFLCGYFPYFSCFFNKFTL